MSTLLSAAGASFAGDDHAVRAFFHVTADAEPTLLPRLVEPLARRGLVPDRFHASTESGDRTEFSVDLRVSRLSRLAADRIAGNLRAVVGVRAVIAVFEDEP